MASGNRVAHRQRQTPSPHDAALEATATQTLQRQPQQQRQDSPSPCNLRETATSTSVKRKGATTMNTNSSSTPTKPKETRAQRDGSDAKQGSKPATHEKQPRATAAPRQNATSHHSTPTTAPPPQINVNASNDDTVPTPQDSPSDNNAPSFSWDDILRVQNLIERCLQQFLSKEEIVSTLSIQAKIDPEFTRVVWQKLEIQNPSFFKAYAIQLQLKDQILAFNYLVKQQKEMMAKLDSFGVYGASSSSCSGATSLNLPSIQVDSQYFVTKSIDTPASSSLTMTDFASSPFAASELTVSHHPAAAAAAADAVAGATATASLVASAFPLPSPIKTDLDTHAFFS